MTQDAGPALLCTHQGPGLTRDISRDPGLSAKPFQPPLHPLAGLWGAPAYLPGSAGPRGQGRPRASRARPCPLYWAVTGQHSLPPGARKPSVPRASRSAGPAIPEREWDPTGKPSSGALHPDSAGSVLVPTSPPSHRVLPGRTEKAAASHLQPHRAAGEARTG